MSYHKVIYDKLFPYAPYLNERIGVEMLVEVGQDPLEALKQCKDIVEGFYQDSLKSANNAQLQPSIEQLPPVIQQKEEPETKLSREDKQKKLIMGCTALEGADGLYSYKLLIKTNPHLQETYRIKLVELSNK